MLRLPGTVGPRRARGERWGGPRGGATPSRAGALEARGRLRHPDLEQEPRALTDGGPITSGCSVDSPPFPPPPQDTGREGSRPPSWPHGGQDPAEARPLQTQSAARSSGRPGSPTSATAIPSITAATVMAYPATVAVTAAATRPSPLPSLCEVTGKGSSETQSLLKLQAVPLAPEIPPGWQAGAVGSGGHHAPLPRLRPRKETAGSEPWWGCRPGTQLLPTHLPPPWFPATTGPCEPPALVIQPSVTSTWPHLPERPPSARGHGGQGGQSRPGLVE